MKLVRVRATDLDWCSKQKNRNDIHMYTIESNLNDGRLIKIDTELSKLFCSDGNSDHTEGHTSTFYVNIEQVAEFKKCWKELKIKYKEG